MLSQSPSAVEKQSEAAPAASHIDVGALLCGDKSRRKSWRFDAGLDGARPKIALHVGD